MMKQIDTTAANKPQSDWDKRDQDANRQHHYDNLDEEEVEVIRPSIPSIIPLKRSSRHADDRYSGNSSSPLDDDGDDSSEISLSSLVSEVTLMTFSEEKAAMLKSEFLSRVQLETRTRPLSREEKVALLTEIQADQDKKFKTEIQRQESKRSIERQGAKTKHEFFERLNALRVNNEEEREDGDQQQEEQGGGNCQNVIFIHDEEHTPDRRSYLAKRRASLKRRQSVSSDITEKRNNSCRSLVKNENERYSTDQTTAASASSLDSNSEPLSAPPRISGTTAIGDIQTVIELKMEIANQQATIDTITARLHNLEIENTKLSSSLSREKKARMAAEKLNADLTIQLMKRYDEGQLQSGVSNPAFRPPMMKQSSTVDWGDDDNNMNKDGSDRSFLDKVKELEEKNERLSMENMRLTSLLHERKESIYTDSTDVSTSLDSSEHKPSAQGPPRQRTRRPRIDESFGASLRSIGTILTKMPRSRSDFGINEFATFQEELMTEQTPSPKSLDHDERDSQGNSTATNTTDIMDNDYKEDVQGEGGVLRSHKKAQRRWSSGDEWRQQKQMEESARETRRAERRRWSSYKDVNEEAEEVKGVGGWLNGFFGKADEDVDGKSAGSSQRKGFSRNHIT